MTNKKIQLVVVGLSLGVALTVTGLLARAENNPSKLFTRKTTAQQPEQGKNNEVRSSRNLSMQPQAFQMSRRLGKRFASTGRDKSVLIGTITITSDSRQIQVVRSQTDDGEELEVQVAGAQSPVTWNSTTGALSSKSRATGSERELIERIVHDSPDQFVLAQLRGAAYYTVQRSLRPASADAKYSGDVWDVVRVTDPEPDQSKQPLSRWRLYYLNTRTGLIDKIESEVAGERVLAEILGWVDVNGEKVPAQIRWTSNGKPLMRYSLTTFSKAAN
jgi:hypothetical protein